MASMAKLREEHVELLPWVENVLVAADRIGDTSLETLKETLDEVYEFLVAHLIPHAEAEDAVMYPEVERITGAAGLMATMSRDHVEVGRLTEELARLHGRLAAVTPGHAQEKHLRRVLYGLYALVHVHFAKEEEILVPILERGLTDEDAARMFSAMEEIEARVRERGMERIHPGSRTLTA